MKRRQVADILMSHADGLVADVDNTESILRAYPDANQELGPLLRLARTVKGALVPISPEPSFVYTLQAQLAKAEIEPEPVKVQTGRILGIAGAAVGSLLSVAGVILWIRQARLNRSEAVTTAA